MKIEIELHETRKKPPSMEIVNFITKSGEYCFGVFDGSQWFDWSNDHKGHLTKDVMYWWFLPEIPLSGERS